MPSLPPLRRLPHSAWLFFTERVRGVAFRLFERFAAVRPKRWAFVTWPGRYAHTLDNPRAVFEEVKHDPTIEKVVLRRRGQDPSTAIAEGVNVRFVQIESLEGAWLLATAEVLFTGYSLGSLCSYGRWLTTKHKIVQLWHGIPLKRIGKLFPGETHWDRETSKYYATVCSSERDREIMSAAFAPLPPERTWLTGLPRNDLILKDESQLPADYRRDLQRLRGALAGRKLVLYAPTWREASAGQYRFSAAELAALEALMERHHAVFGIRAHANRRRSADEAAKPWLLYLNDYPDVSVLLRETALLITDYSSIYIDFLVTGRPCAFFAYDLEEYLRERGFLYEYATAITGQAALTFAHVAEQIASALAGEPSDGEAYRRAHRLFHTHTGSPSASVTTRLLAEAPAAARGP